MTAKYKIFYDDDSTLLWSDVSPNGDPQQIHKSQRIGVHSIIQPMPDGITREVIEQYHYLFSIRDNGWVGVGVDGLMDHIVNDFDNIRCVLSGRTGTMGRFWNIKQKAMVDTEIIGGASTQSVYENTEAQRGWLYNYNDPFYQNGVRGNYFDPRKEFSWPDVARHQPYDAEHMETPPYGRQEFRH